MSGRNEQARAYLDQARTTLDSARVLFESDAERFAPQIVKNGYDALESAAFDWLARRSRTQYVDFEGNDLAVPSDAFDESDAEQILADAEAILRFVESEIEASETG